MTPDIEQLRDDLGLPAEAPPRAGKSASSFGWFGKLLVMALCAAGVWLLFAYAVIPLLAFLFGFPFEHPFVTAFVVFVLWSVFRE